MNDVLAAHLRELEISRTPGHPKRLLPAIPPTCQRVLDIGCGLGQSLMACDLPPQTEAHGVDYDHTLLAHGRGLAPGICFTRASGEQLPFPGASFDFVMSRVALPYMLVPQALDEIHRVLRPGGQIWLLLHPISYIPWRNSLTAPKRTAFEIYRLCNTASFAFFGWQFRYPLKRTWTESYQTQGAMTRYLRKLNYQSIRFNRDEHHFLVQANKPS